MNAAAFVLAAVLAGQGGKVDWSRDVEKSARMAKKSGRPVMMLFAADW